MYETLASILAAVGIDADLYKTLVSALAAAGITGVIIGAVLKHSLEKAIEKTVGHRFDKLLEDRKAENVLLSKRHDAAMDACQDLHALVEEINSELTKLKVENNQNYINELLTEFHPKYRRRFQFIRTKFEASNDMFSSYSIQLDRLTHPDVIKDIAQSIEKRNPSNIRRLYRKVWITVSEAATSLVRVCSDYRFWEPNKNYGRRADKWAAYDFARTIEFLRGCAGPETQKEHIIFYLSIEDDGGTERFWEHEPPKHVPSP